MAGSFLQKMKPYYIRKALRYLRHYGVRDFAVRVRERLAPDEVPYGPWLKKHQADEEELAWQRAEFPTGGDERRPPLFSIVVPAYRTPEKFLEEMIRSVRAQTFPFWELIVVNASPDEETMGRVLQDAAREDSRIRVLPLSENKGIASNTNAGIAAAKGEFVGFLDHDDVLMPDALYEAYQAVRRNCKAEKSAALAAGPAAEGAGAAGRGRLLWAERLAASPVMLIYTDEDKIREDGEGGTEHFQPHFKPDFNPDLLRANNYICHFLIVRRTLAMDLGGLSGDFDGAQDYEFILRCVDRICSGDRFPVRETAIVHIPRILYSWRVHASSTADNPDSKAYAYEAGRRALQEHLDRRGLCGRAVQRKDYGFYRVEYEEEEHPLVSILIPNREQKKMLEKCLDAIREHTRHDRYEVIVIENNSSSGEILRYYKEIQGKDHVRVIRYRGPFNYSAINNYGVSKAGGSYLVFMNNDVQVRDGWLEELLSVCERKGTGAAGPRLLYPDGRIQSAGVVVGIGSTAGSLFTGMKGEFSGYLHRADTMQDLSAVTGALMMVKRTAFEQAGGFSEELAVAFNDVDLCLKIREQGYLVVYDPHAGAIHHESASRGDEYTDENAARFKKEAEYLRTRWADYYENGDPYYNRNLSLAKWNYALDPD